jgi:hypothetical protein
LLPLQSIITRLRIIVVNFRNILMQLGWLFGLFVLDVLTYVQPASSLWPRVLVFWLFSRGFVDLVCWFWVNGDVPSHGHHGRSRSSVSASASSPAASSSASSVFKRRFTGSGAASGLDVNLNKSLQKEMTVGQTGAQLTPQNPSQSDTPALMMTLSRKPF